MSGTIPINIHVKTSVDHEGVQEVFEVTALGLYDKKKDAFFLRYEEVTEEGNTKTIVKIASDEALILRSGAVKMRLPFRRGEELIGSYETPFGTFTTVSLMKKMNYVDMTETVRSGHVDLQYDLSIQGSHAGTYHLQLTFKEEAK